VNFFLAVQSGVDPNSAITPVTDLILTWTHIGQALVASVGALGRAYWTRIRPSCTNCPLRSATTAIRFVAMR